MLHALCVNMLKKYGFSPKMNVLFTAVMLQTYIFFHNKMIFLQNILTIVSS